MPRTRLGRALLRTSPVSTPPSSPSPLTNSATTAPAPSTTTTTTTTTPHAIANTSVSKNSRVSVHNKAKKDSATSNRVLRKKGAPRGLAVAQARGSAQTLAAPAPVSVASAGGLSAGIRTYMLPLLSEWTACLFWRTQAGLATSPEQQQGMYAQLWSLLQPVIATASDSDHNGPLFIEGAHALVRAVVALGDTGAAEAGQGAITALEQGALTEFSSVGDSVNADAQGAGTDVGSGVDASKVSRDGLSGLSGRSITVSTNTKCSTIQCSEITSLTATTTTPAPTPLGAPTSAPCTAPLAVAGVGIERASAATPLAETRGETVAAAGAVSAIKSTLRVASAGALQRARLCGAMGLMAQESREYGASHGGSTVVWLHEMLQGADSGLTHGASSDVLRDSHNGSASSDVSASAFAGGSKDRSDTENGSGRYPEKPDAKYKAQALTAGSKRSGVSGVEWSAVSSVSASASASLPQATKAVVTTQAPSKDALKAALSTATTAASACAHITTAANSSHVTNATGAATVAPYLLSLPPEAIPAFSTATWQELYTLLGYALSHDSTNFRVTSLRAIIAAILKLEEAHFYAERALFLATRSDLSREGWLAVLQAATQKKGGRSDILTNSWFLGQVESFYREYVGRELLVRSGSASSPSAAPATVNVSAALSNADSSSSSSSRLSKVRAKAALSEAWALEHSTGAAPISSTAEAAAAANTRAAPAPQRGTATATIVLAPQLKTVPAQAHELSVQDALAQAALADNARGRQLLARLQAASWPQLRLEQWAEALAQESMWLLQVVKALLAGQQNHEQGHDTIRVSYRESLSRAASAENRGSAASTALLSVGVPQLEAITLTPAAGGSANGTNACVSTARDNASADSDLLDAASAVSAVLPDADSTAACAVTDAADDDDDDDAAHAVATDSAAHYHLSVAVYNALEQSQILLLPLRSYSYTYPDTPPVPLKIMAVWEGASTDSTEINAAGAVTATGSAITKEAASAAGKGVVPQGAAVTTSLKAGAGNVVRAQAALAGSMRHANLEQAVAFHQITGGTSVPAYAASTENTVTATAGSNGVVSVAETASLAPLVHATANSPASAEVAAASASAATDASAVDLSQEALSSPDTVESGLLAKSSPRLLQWWQDKGQKKQRLSSYESLVRWGPQFNLVVYAPKLEEALRQGRAHDANLAADARKALRSYLCQRVGPAFVRYGLASLQLVHDSSELMSLRLYQVQVYAALNAASGAEAGTKTETVWGHAGDSSLAELCVASGMSLRSFARLELLQLTQPLLLEMAQLPAFLKAHSLDTAFSLERVLGRTYIYRYRQLGYKRPLSAYAQKYPLRTDVFLGCTQARELIQEYYAVRLFKTRGPRLYTPVYSALQQEGVTAVFVYVTSLSNATGAATYDGAALNDSAVCVVEAAPDASATGHSALIAVQAQPASSVHGAQSAALPQNSPAFVASAAVEHAAAKEQTKVATTIETTTYTDGAVSTVSAVSAANDPVAGSDSAAVVSEASLLSPAANISGASTTTNSTIVLGSDADLAAQRQSLGAVTATALSSKQSTSASAYRGMAVSPSAQDNTSPAHGGSDADNAQQPQGAGVAKIQDEKGGGGVDSNSGEGSSLSCQQSSHSTLTTTTALTTPAPETPAPNVALSLELLTQVERAIAIALQEQVAGIEGPSSLSMTALAQVTGYACGSKYLYLDFMVGSLPLFVQALARAQELLERWQVPVGRLCYHSFRRED